MKGMERGTFSALDALWILLGVILLVLLFLFLLPTLGTSGEPYEVRYVLRVRDVDPLMVGEDAEALIPPGSGVYSENGTAALGRVERVESAPQMRARVTSGELVFEEATDAVILEITVLGKATLAEGDGVRISDVRIAAGSIGSFRLGSFYAARAAVTAVEVYETEEVS
jgi:hypothetical protein